MENKKTLGGWLKAKRQALLTVAFVLLWAAFPLGYLGGTRAVPGLVTASFALIGAACLLCILARK